MIIDFHTHIFPDAIAFRTIQHLQTIGGLKAATDGTLTGLKESMKNSNVNISVVLPVVTKPSQFATINEFAAKITGLDGILSFGGIHPMCTDISSKLDQICTYNLKGIKLHPDYQQTFIDDLSYLHLITEAVNRNLIVSIHAGIDVGYPNPVHCPPKKARFMLDYVLSHTTNPNPVIILAHTGGIGQWDEVESYLCGQNVYFDISSSLPLISESQLIRMIRTHGSERFLFGTDSPWSDQKDYIQKCSALSLSQEEKDNLFFRNGKNLLQL